jgi:hypothetical protein
MGSAGQHRSPMFREINLCEMNLYGVVTEWPYAEKRRPFNDSRSEILSPIRAWLENRSESQEIHPSRRREASARRERLSPVQPA